MMTKELTATEVLARGVNLFQKENSSWTLFSQMFIDHYHQNLCVLNRELFHFAMDK